MTAAEASASGPGAHWSEVFAGADGDSMLVYDAILARLFTPWAHELIDRLAPPPGCAALDVACGPGTVSRVLAERIGPQGRVLATDLSPAMLQVARSKPIDPRAAIIQWEQAPAAQLPVPDDAVDIVSCQQGLQFFPDRLAALVEMRRVLRVGGRAGIAVWTRVEDQVFGHLRDAIAHVLSPEIAEGYLGPFSLAGEDAAADARRAGFEHVALEHLTLPAVLEGGVAELLATLPTTGLASTIAALSTAERAELYDETVRRTEPIRRGQALHGSLTSSLLILS